MMEKEIIEFRKNPQRKKYGGLSAASLVGRRNWKTEKSL